jgi:hypothetical protein
MKKNTKSRRAFVNAATSMMGAGAAAMFLSPSSPRSGVAFALMGPGPGGVVGRAFLQVTIFDRMPDDVVAAFFDAINRHYDPVLLKAPGLISYQQFKHFDLPMTLDLQLWDSREEALAFYDGEVSKRVWKQALESISPSKLASIPKEYLEQHHSDAHRHYILSKSLKG